MKATVVIPTLNGRERLLHALASVQKQTHPPAAVVVVDNASTDGTADAVAQAFPDVIVLRNDENVGFGRAVNRGAEAAVGDALVLVNNDVVLEPDFLDRLLAPLADERVGMVAGVLLQARDPGRIDSAGIELDVTLQSYDLLWNEPVERLEDDVPEPIGPCGGAAAYRLEVFRAAGGFDDAFFAYWEDVDLALRLRLAGWRCAAAPAARAHHHHGATLGGASPAQRRLEAFGRAFVLARYRVRGRMKIALVDWPALLVHLVVRRERGPIRERRRGRREGRARDPLRAPLELATVSLGEALARQWRFLGLRARGRLPAHFGEAGERPVREADQERGSGGTGRFPQR
jgi:N-acetylglucosaminyl-diphospho-decaprenol L-rhamnosyltransferase